MSIEAKNVAILVDDYFEESELSIPTKILKMNKCDVTIISAKKKKVQSMKETDKSRVSTADLLLEDAASKDYDALVLPGGIINSSHLRINEKAQSWVIDFVDSGKLVAASGYSSLILVSADLIEEKQLTSPPEIQDDILNAGGEWTNRPVVVDGNLITSSGVDSSRKFSDRIVTWLK